jgi:hypothetical protein
MRPPYLHHRHYGTVMPSGREITVDYVESILQEEARAVKRLQPELQAQTDAALAYVIQVVRQNLIGSHLTASLRSVTRSSDLLS